MYKQFDGLAEFNEDEVDLASSVLNSLSTENIVLLNIKGPGSEGKWLWADHKAYLDFDVLNTISFGLLTPVKKRVTLQLYPGICPSEENQVSIDNCCECMLTSPSSPTAVLKKSTRH